MSTFDIDVEMLPRKTPLVLLFALFASVFASMLFAQSQPSDIGLTVAGVRSPQMITDPITGNRWMQIEVQVQTGNNTNPAAVNKNYFERIKVRALFAWGSKRNNQFSIQTAFESTAEIAAQTTNTTQSVYFYLPPEVVLLWNLRSSAPTFYYVELSYAGVIATPSRQSVSSVMKDGLEHVEAFRQVCAEKVSANQGIMVPHNLAPSYFMTNQYLSRSVAALVFPTAPSK